MKNCIRWITFAAVLLLPLVPASAITPDSITRGLSKVFNAADVDYPPVPIRRPAPSYSPELRAARIKGAVTVDLVVGLKGEVVGAQVTSSDDTRLNPTVLAAVQTWIFKPAKHKGHEVFCRTSTLLIVNLVDNT